LPYTALADAVVVVHLAFVAFVVVGGFLTWCWPRMAWLHVPAFCWGIWVEYSGWICPLTPLENHLRLLAGEQRYSGGFVSHYLLPILYPPGLTRPVQWALGTFVLLLNGFIYIYLWRRIRR
jgi:hypothetical protein